MNSIRAAGIAYGMEKAAAYDKEAGPIMDTVKGGVEKAKKGIAKVVAENVGRGPSKNTLKPVRLRGGGQWAHKTHQLGQQYADYLK
jgi:hypothetical protein